MTGLIFDKLLAAFTAVLSPLSKKPPLTLTKDVPSQKLMFAAGIFILCLFLWRLVTVPVLHPLRIFPDQAMFVAIGELLLQGKRPYVDLFDINPPLPLYAHMLPAAVARLWAIPPPQAFAFTIIGLWLYSVIFCLWLMWRESDHKESFLFMPLLLSYSYLTLWLSEKEEFGQREHIYLLLFLPFFLIRWLRWNGRPIPAAAAILAGLVASVGLFFKQYYLIAAIVLELLWWVEKRRWRCLVAPETVTCAVFGLAYAGFLLTLPEDIKSGYFSFMVPIFASGYGEYCSSIIFQLLGWGQAWDDHMLLLACTCGLGVALMRYSTLIMPLLAFTLVGFASYLMQGQPWLNHMVPFMAGSYMLAGVEAAILVFIVRQFLPPVLKRLDFVWLAALCLWQQQIAAETISRQGHDLSSAPKLAIAPFGDPQAVPKEDLNELAPAILRYTQPGDAVLCMSRSIGPGYPILLQLNRRPASRYLHAMLLPTLIFARENSVTMPVQTQMDLFKNQVVRGYKQDIKAVRPKLIFISPLIWDILGGVHFDQDTLDKDYVFSGVIEEARVYIRKDVPGCPAPMAK